MPQLGQQHPGQNQRPACHDAGRDYFSHPPTANGGDYLDKDKKITLLFY
jgi:hypothetical protein